MKVFIVYYHPEAKSFNHAMFETAVGAFEKRGDQIAVSDLAAMRFNPVSGRDAYMRVKDPDCFKQQTEELNASETKSFAPFIDSEQEKIENCDFMLMQFPLWWFGMPAVLKGWCDRCFAMGRIYGNGRFYKNGIKAGSKAMISITTGGPREAYVENGMNGDMHQLLRPILHGCLEFIGFSVLEPNIVYAPAHMTPDERAKALADYAARIAAL